MINVCDHGHAYWREILRYDGSEASFQTVRNIHRSYLQASFETVA